jgi:hypothetical protein
MSNKEKLEIYTLYHGDCLETNRNYILMEKEQIYFDVANKRIEELICTK